MPTDPFMILVTPEPRFATAAGVSPANFCDDQNVSSAAAMIVRTRREACNINSALRNYPHRVQLSAPLRNLGRRPGFRPGFRQVRAGLRPARDFLEGGSKAGRRQVRTCLYHLFSTQKCRELVADRTNLSKARSRSR